jgi:DNA ligase-1
VVEPTVVIEVAFNNIQKSARHESGYALRFPRILRLRPDKNVSQIDTLERVAELYAKQITLPKNAR